MYKAKLRPLTEIYLNCQVELISKHCERLWHPDHTKPILLRKYYQKYFGSDKYINVRPKKRIQNRWEMVSDKGMQMNDVLPEWFELGSLYKVLSNAEWKMTTTLTNKSWDDLFEV